MRDMSEKEVIDLRKRNIELEAFNKEMKPTIDSLTLQLNDMKNKYEQKLREVDKLKEDLKRKEKSAEDKLNLVNCKLSFYNNVYVQKVISN